MNYLISADALLNNVPQAVAAATNLATQLGTGYTNQDTSIYIAVKKAETGLEDNWNWETFGAAFQLATAQILKISAGAADIEVSPTSY